ncbi:MAG: hypothetical protein RLZZ244_1157 [Verrucomicrobiota bacterium]
MGSEDRQYFKELRLQQFRGLLAVVRSGSFSVAAKELQLTKASVWQQVRALEEEFQCDLLETNGRKITATPQGLRLAQLAAPLVEGFDSIKAAFAADLAQLPAALSVATTPYCLAYELRGAIDQLRTLFPKAHLTFHDRNSPAAIEMLESGDADIAVAARFAEWPDKPGLDFLPLSQHPFALAAPPEHPLLSQTALQLSDLAPFPLLLPGPTANCRPHLENLLRQAGLWERLNLVLECSFPGSLFEYVGAGLGIAVTPVPPALLRHGHPLGIAPLAGRHTVLRDLSELLGFEPVFLIRRKGWIETPIGAAFRRAVLPASA